MFTGRQMKIIELIVGNVQGIFGSKIADSLQVSSRTVRGEIQAINALWKEKCKIQSSHQYGYYFEDKDLTFVRNLLHQSKHNQSSCEENRILAMLGILLHKGETDIYEISEIMYLSVPSIQRGCAKLKGYLKKEYQIEPVVLHGEHIVINLDEEDIRKLMMRIVKNEISRTSQIKLPILKELLYDAFDQMEFTYLTKKIEEYLSKRQIYLTDDQLIMISSAIYISYVRNLGEHFILHEIEYEKDEAAEELLRYLAEVEFAFYEKDKALLHDYLHIFKLNSMHEEMNEISDFSIRLFDELCDEVLDKYNLDLRSSTQLYHNMLIHFEYMIRRLHGNYELVNPIIHDVKKNFPFSYEISMLLVHIVYKNLNKFIQDDEISFVAIYIEHFMENVNHKLQVVIVETPRRSVMNIMQSWLKQHFDKQLSFVSVPGQHSLDEYIASHNVEFIITLSDMVTHPTIPIYRIGDFPGDVDLVQIHSIIKKIRINYRFQEILKAIFSPELVQIYNTKQEFEDVMKTTSERLEEQDKIENAEAFYEDIMLREVNYPTFLNERFMVPHPLATFAKNTAVNVAILKEPISVNQHAIQIIFTLATERKQNNDVNVLFQFFKQIAQRKDAMDALCGVSSSSELFDILLAISYKL